MAGTPRIVRSAISGALSHSRNVEALKNKCAFLPARRFSVSSSRNMKFIQFSYNDKPGDLRVGYIEGDKVVDLHKVDSKLSSNLLDILKNDQVATVSRLKSTNPASVPFSSVKLAPPLTGIDKILCVGLNYKDHCQEQNLTPPTVPMIFNKFPSTIVGPNDAVRLRTQTTKIGFLHSLYQLIMISKLVCLSIPAERAWNSYKYCGRNSTRETRRNLTQSQPNLMKFVQFLSCGDPEQIHVGYMVDDCSLVDLNREDLRLPFSMLDVLRNPLALKKIEKIRARNPKTIPLSHCSLASPILGMDKVIGIDVNYKDFCGVHRLRFPDQPTYFGKFASTIVGPDGFVRIRSRLVQKVDFEVELTVVIGKPASFVTADRALDYVFGYTIAQDISARDWQKERNGGQFLLGKSMDTFCPIGPWIVTADEVGDPHQLGIRCSLNGKVMQDSNTCQLINNIPAIIERLTSVMTLLPGDIILTGTPGGVGMYRNPPVYLCPGDMLVSEIDKLGSLCTRVEQF